MTDDKLEMLAMWFRAEVQRANTAECRKKTTTQIESIIKPMDESDRVELFHYLNERRIV